MKSKETVSGDSTYIKKCLSEVWKLLSKINKGPVHVIKKVMLSKPALLFLKFPWTLLAKLPGISILARPIQALISQSGEKKDSEKYGDINKPPLVEEITIPSVIELSKSQVRFVAAKGNISTISFDSNKATLHLPPSV